MVKRGNTTVTQLLVLWKDLPLTEATSKNIDDFCFRFPEFHLEDKVVIIKGALSQLEPKKMRANAEEEGFNSNQAYTTALGGSGKEFKH
jgi:hypothetical protein